MAKAYEHKQAQAHSETGQELAEELADESPRSLSQPSSPVPPVLVPVKILDETSAVEVIGPLSDTLQKKPSGDLEDPDDLIRSPDPEHVRGMVQGQARSGC